jgi:hypothetical protein
MSATQRTFCVNCFIVKGRASGRVGQGFEFMALSILGLSARCCKKRLMSSEKQQTNKHERFSLPAVSWTPSQVDPPVGMAAVRHVMCDVRRVMCEGGRIRLGAPEHPQTPHPHARTDDASYTLKRVSVWCRDVCAPALAAAGRTLYFAAGCYARASLHRASTRGVGA